MISAEDSVYTNENSQQRISLNMSWQAPLSNCNEIAGYTVVVGTTNSSSSIQQTLQDLYIVIPDLDPYTKYAIEVIAENNEGLVSKASMEWLTSAAKPFDPPNVDLEFNTSCAFLNISSPLVSNGVITEYKYFCVVMGETEPPLQGVNASDRGITQLEVCGFSSASNISCSVIAVNAAGDSPAANLTGFTSLKLKNETETSDLVKITDSGDTRTVELTVKPVQFENMAPTPLKYQILVTKEMDNNQSANSTFFDGKYCDLEKRNEFAIARTLKQACYVAVEISSSILKPEGLTFVIGDDRLFGGYHNVPLKPDRNYSLMVAIILNLQNGADYSFFLKPFTFYSSAQEDTELLDTELFKTDDAKAGCSDSCLTIIFALLGAVLVVVILLVLYFLRARIREHFSMCRRRQAKARDAEQDMTILTSPQQRPLPLPNSIQNIPLKPIDIIPTYVNDEIEHSSGYSNYAVEISTESDTECTYSTTDHCDHKIHSSLELVNIEKNISLRLGNALANDFPKKSVDEGALDDAYPRCKRLPPLPAPRGCPIRRAFKSVEASLRSVQPTYTFANKECNHDKNRVLDILPDDEHLVHLESGQYINAVYVDSYDKKNHIIATQLPLPHTVKDFWEMIIQEKVKIILQLDRNKEVERLLYGSTDEMKIEVTADRTAKCLTKKSLTVNGCPVSVFLSGAWTSEDYYSDDVPDIDILLHHIEALGKHQEQSGDGKICVVDRDGCHRCGVFIAAYNMIIAMFKISNEEDLTIADAILKVRERRHQFLSNFQAHELIYKVHNHFSEEYEADYEHFAVEMRLRDYTNIE